MIATNWLYSNAIGGVKLQVEEPDAERALEILAVDQLDSKTTREGQPQCPKCGSSNTHYVVFNQRVVFASWLLTPIVSGSSGFPLPFFKKKWECSDCDSEWQDKPERISSGTWRYKRIWIVIGIFLLALVAIGGWQSWFTRGLWHNW